ncbi:hypothetical protein ACH4E8_33520 [Streptomyces sp. NPDC017979]|uniref:hypothetical protein n=1 Tax=Streptomyces sp. NPDC017979 TaxID=3365024 RepID=UPI0037BD00C7
MTAEALLARWPTAAPKAELFHGALVFAGNFDERDVEAARRTYPGRHPMLNADGGLEVHPGEPDRRVRQTEDTVVTVFELPG